MVVVMEVVDWGTVVVLLSVSQGLLRSGGGPLGTSVGVPPSSVAAVGGVGHWVSRGGLAGSRGDVRGGFRQVRLPRVRGERRVGEGALTGALRPRCRVCGESATPLRASAVGHDLEGRAHTSSPTVCAVSVVRSCCAEEVRRVSSHETGSKWGGAAAWSSLVQLY